MAFYIGFLPERGAYHRPLRILCEQSEAFFYMILVPDLRIGLQNAGSAVGVLRPWPLPYDEK